MSACPANGTVTAMTPPIAAASSFVVPSTAAPAPRISRASAAEAAPFSAERDPIVTW